MHPRTRDRIDRRSFKGDVLRSGALMLIDPLGYADFLAVMKDSAVVLTDSGGIQEETTVLGIPCLTMRENTERPVTVERGTNTLVGLDRSRILKETENILEGRAKKGSVPELWDGRAADRIAAKIMEIYSTRAAG